MKSEEAIPFTTFTRRDMDVPYEPAPGPTIKVRAVRVGVYPQRTVLGEDSIRRREGDVFTLFPRWVTAMRIHADECARCGGLEPEHFGGKLGHAYRPAVVPGEQRPIMENGNVKRRLMTAEEQFSDRWMERVDDNEPEVMTSAPIALARATNEIKKSRRAN